MWRGLILTKALEQFLTDVRWGDMDYLLVDMPPGTGDVQMGLARMLPQAEMLVVTTPALAAQKVATRVADMARRSYMKVVGVVENMSEFVRARRLAPRGVRQRWRRRRWPREIGVPLVARIPIEPAVSSGGDAGHAGRARARPTARRASRSASSPARIVSELLPPIEMAAAPHASSTSSAMPSTRNGPGRRPGPLARRQPTVKSACSWFGSLVVARRFELT